MLGAGAVSLSRVCVDLQVRFHLSCGLACAESLVCVISQLFTLQFDELAPAHPLAGLLAPHFFGGFLTEFQTHFFNSRNLFKESQRPRTKNQIQGPRVKNQGLRVKVRERESRTKTQGPRAKDQEPDSRTKSQEPRAKGEGPRTEIKDQIPHWGAFFEECHFDLENTLRPKTFTICLKHIRIL